MKITDFALQISKQEGLKKGVNIAQISEVLKITNNLLDGEVYSLIRKQGTPSNRPMSAKKTVSVKKKIAIKSAKTNRKKS